MGRKKLAMRRIENAATRQVTYAKRKDGIVKKASELSVLCDTDVAVVMFSLSTFASNGRVEDNFLRFVDRPDELGGGMNSGKDADEGGTMGPHLSPSFIEALKQWKKISNGIVNPKLDNY